MGQSDKSLRIEWERGFRVLLNGKERKLSPRKAVPLLSRLVSTPRHSLSRSQTAAWLWPEASPTKADANLRQLLVRMRRDLGDPDIVQLAESTIHLGPYNVSSDQGVDCAGFRTLVEEQDCDGSFDPHAWAAGLAVAGLQDSPKRELAKLIDWYSERDPLAGMKLLADAWQVASAIEGDVLVNLTKRLLRVQGGGTDRGWVLALQGAGLMSSGHAVQAKPVLQDAFHIGRRAKEFAMSAQAAFWMTFSLTEAREYRSAARIVRWLFDLGTETQDRLTLGRAHHLHGAILWHHREFKQAELELCAAIKHLECSESPIDLVHARSNYAVMARDLGSPEIYEQQRMLSEGLLAEVEDWRLPVVFEYAGMLAATLSGDPYKALSAGANLEQRFRQHEPMPLCLRTMVLEADALAAEQAGEEERALRDLRQANDLRRKLGYARAPYEAARIVSLENRIGRRRPRY